MHLLPGMAVFAHRYHTPMHLRGWRGMLHCSRQTLAALLPGGGGSLPAAGACWGVGSSGGVRAGERMGGACMGLPACALAC